MKTSFKQNRSLSVLISVAAYLLALVIAILAARPFTGSHPLLTIAVADAAATLTIFILSIVFNNSSMYDPYWSVKPAVIAGYFALAAMPDGLTARQLIVTVLVFLYAIRLTSNFYRDWPGLVHEDWRYVNFRRQFPKMYWLVSFFGIHFFPTLMVYLSCMPIYGIFQPGGNPLSWIDAIAIVVIFSAVLLAFIADEQLRRFRRLPSSSGQFITTGLWSLSRHPNYLGEVMTWWGLYLFALAAGTQWWWTGIGALAIHLMFVFISIPLMEKRTIERREGYAAYAAMTARLFPLKGIKR